MCGICGVAYRERERPVDPRLLETMRRHVRHRGPDGLGLRTWPGAGIGHTRLSIIDLPGGAQPLSNEDGSVWVTFNGEIYNYRSLTAELEDRGHRFRTRSDTEVLVHLYEEHGVDFPKRLDGMFALALYDRDRRRTVLVRDHLGIKPLFYAVTDDGLFYASNVRAVLAGAGLSPSVHPAGLQEYLIFRYVSAPRSFFKDVRRLPPGHTAVWTHRGLKVSCYWDLPPSPSNTSAPQADVAMETRRSLKEAVSRQLVSDVPVGTFCSGGIDSGLVTGYASRAAEETIDTFSVGFEDPEWDETPLARDTAGRFSTRHHVRIGGPGDIPALLHDLVRYHDEPLSHPNSVPLYLLSKFARERVKVVLTGEGADELFCGYPRYHIARLRGILRHLPPSVLGLGRLLKAVPGHRADKLAHLLPRSVEDSLLLNSAYVAQDTVAELTGRPVREAFAHRRRILRRAMDEAPDAVQALSRFELQTYLTCALDRMDSMSMASGLEARVPFLDVDLVSWAVRLPTRMKLRGRTAKWVLKEAARSQLSERIVEGRKSGFGLPLGDWFRRSEFRPLTDRLMDPRHPAAEHIESDCASALVREHREGRADHGELLWLLANLFAWTEVWSGGLDTVPTAGSAPSGT